MTTSLRRMSRRWSILASVLLLELGGAAPTAAEPIVVTSGFLQVQTRINEGFFQFEGKDFLFTGGFDGIFGSFSLACDPCSPGTPVELDSQFSMNQGRGRAVVDGTTYPEIWFDGMTVAFDVPTAPITGSETRLLVLPFTFSGLVEFLAIDPNLGPSDPVFSTSLSGRGRAIAEFTYRADIDVFTAESELRYEFDDTDPIPEPATLLLCGFGTTALAVIRRRQNRYPPASGLPRV